MKALYKNPLSTPQTDFLSLPAEIFKFFLIEDPSGVHPSSAQFPEFFPVFPVCLPVSACLPVLCADPLQYLFTLFRGKTDLRDIVQRPHTNRSLCITEIFIHRKNYKLNIREFFFTHLHQFQSIDLRHINIRKHDVHRMSTEKFQSLSSVLYISRHLESILFPVHNSDQAFSGKFIIINDQYVHLLVPPYLLPM